VARFAFAQPNGSSVAMMTSRSLAFFASLMMVSTPLCAEVAPGGAPSVELETTARALERSKSRERVLRGEAAVLARDEQALAGELIEAAAQIRARETMIAASHARIAALENDERALRARLAASKDELSAFLSGLLRLEQNPPPALLASPGDVLQALRAAMLFRAAVPALRSQTAALSHDLSRLTGLKASIAREEQDLAANLGRMRSAKLQLETLYERKKALLAAAGDALAKEQARAAELAKKAKSLQQLVDSLAAAEAKRRERARQEAALQQSVVPDSAAAVPQHPFSKSLGKLHYPVLGELVGRFGDADGLGGRIKGLFIATRPGAQVVVPAHGRVAFAGNFRSYGQLLILDVGEGYHVLLAGMARMEVATGQRVVSGEPVGEMGQASALGNRIGHQKDARPVLYVEFRKAGSAVDSANWWIGGNKEARNQKGMH
jgi:septal ring factor EnvC (AmiA/AmiB activator)